MESDINNSRHGISSSNSVMELESSNKALKNKDPISDSSLDKYNLDSSPECELTNENLIDLDQNSDDESIIIHPSKECNSEFNNNDEYVFIDWPFVDKSVEFNGSSDDESIEIIERETRRPIDFLSVFENESENEDENYRDVSTGINVINVADKNIQTNEEEPTVYSLVEVQNDRIIFTRATLKKILLIYSTFTCIAIASFQIFFIIASSSEKWNFPNDKNLKKETNVLPLDNVGQEDPITFMNYLQDDIKLKKLIIDEMFMHQLEILKHVKYIKNKMYVLNLSELNHSFSTANSKNSIFNLLTSDEKILPCEKNIEIYKSSIVCEYNQHTLFLLNENQLISIYNGIENFFRDYNEKYNHLDSYILRILTKKSLNEDGKHIKEINSFIQDCDNFSKNYKSNFCSKINEPQFVDNSAENKNIHIDDENRNKNENLFASDQKIEEKQKNFQILNVIDNEIIKEKMKDTTKSENRNEENKSIKIAKELKQSIKKFKEEFENLYHVYIEAENLENYDKNFGVENDFKVDVNYVLQNNTSENASEIEILGAKISDSKNNANKTINGEWLFNLNAARTKLRNYNEHTITGDWILKLGRAREKLRKIFRDNKEKNHKKKYKSEEKNRKQWYKKMHEKLKNSYKKVTSQWKLQLKKMKEEIVHNYDKYVHSDWEFNLKNMWRLF